MATKTTKKTTAKPKKSAPKIANPVEALWHALSTFVVDTLKSRREAKAAFRVAVIGPRDVKPTDFSAARGVLDEMLRKHPDMTLSVGDAAGVDTHAAEWASSRGVPVRKFSVRHVVMEPAAKRAFNIAEVFCPHLSQTSSHVQALKIRSVYSLLGRYLSTPVDLVLAVRPHSSRGTEQTLSVALWAGIPVMHLDGKDNVSYGASLVPAGEVVDDLPRGWKASATAVQAAFPLTEESPSANAPQPPAAAPAEPHSRAMAIQSALAAPDAEAPF
jgi:hypothetical protein